MYIKATHLKTTMKKILKIDQTFMNKVENLANCIFKSGRLSLRYFEYVNTLFRSLSSQSIENQQITSAKYTVLMIRVRQNWRNKAFSRSLSYKESYLQQRYLAVLALLLIAS